MLRCARQGMKIYENKLLGPGAFYFFVRNKS